MKRVESSVMLAPSELLPPEKLRYPLLASAKLDGNRCLIRPDGLFTRNMKPQPSAHLHERLAPMIDACAITGISLDGELWSPDMPFNELQSFIRAKDKPLPESIQFYCFDAIIWGYAHSDEFHERLRTARDMAECFPGIARYVEHARVNEPDDVRSLYASMMEMGYEGLILRDPCGHYKYGRATVNEALMFKAKPFETLDAQVIGWEEMLQMREGVERERNELGRMKRTTKAEDREGGTGIMGALIVRDEQGREFSAGWGRGWTQERRRQLWADREKITGKWVEIRYFAHGEKDFPRMPQILRFREEK